MADGRASAVVTLFSTVLSKDNTFPMFAALYASTTATRGSISGLAQLDDTKLDTDISGADFLWLRPASVAGSTLYPSGWPSGALLDLVGAKYKVTSGLSVLPNLPITATPATANATLSFSDGPITAPIMKAIHVSTVNAVKVTPADASFSLLITPSTGLLGGKVTPAGGKALDYRGVILQKGPTAGGYGFVLGAVEAGGVSLFHQ